MLRAVVETGQSKGIDTNNKSKHKEKKRQKVICYIKLEPRTLSLLSKNNKKSIPYRNTP